MSYKILKLIIWVLNCRTLQIPQMMQISKQAKTLSDTYTDTEEQQRKQKTSLIFPSNHICDQLALSKLSQNLAEHFDISEHGELIINHAFKNHRSEMAALYRQYLNSQLPHSSEPKLSVYYSNQSFPDLKVLGQFRPNPLQYSKRHVAPLQEGLFLELDGIFAQYGFIPSLERFLTFFPRYLQKQRIVQKQLFEKTKLTQDLAYFFALCAAAEMGCPYMINRFTIKFLSKGGKIDWIEKKSYSQKIAVVLPLNRKLARCIWEINSEDFEEIVENGFWNINQLALIIQILSFVHALCTITLGLGLRPEQRSSLLSTQNIESLLTEYQQTKNEVLEKSKKQSLKDVLSTLKVIIEESKTNAQNVLPKVNPKRSFRKERKGSEEEENSIIEPYMKEIGNQLTEQRLVSKILIETASFLPEYNSIDKRKDNKSNQFTCVDFNFQFMAYPRLQALSFVAESSRKILAFIKQSEQMGNQNFGTEFVGSTKEFRRAQRYYAENLCGFSHPEYDYKKFMTNILTMPLKYYIRLLMLSPLHMKRQVLDQINHQSGELELFDLGHTAILIAVAKFKLSLTLTTYYFDY